MYKIPVLSYGENIIAAVNYDNVFTSNKIPADGNFNQIKMGMGNNYLLEIDRIRGEVIRKIGEAGPRVLGMTTTPDNKFLFVLRGSLDYRLELYDLRTFNFIGAAPIMKPKYELFKSAGELRRYRNHATAYLRINLAANELLVILEPEISSQFRLREEAGKILVIDMVHLLNRMTAHTSEKVSSSRKVKTEAIDSENTKSSIADDLIKLTKLLDSKFISKEEFEIAKKKLLEN